MTDKDIADIYRDMELRLIESMKRNLGLHIAEEADTQLEYPQWQAIKIKELRKYQKQNKGIVKRSLRGLPSDVAKQLRDELRQGHENEIKKFRKFIGEERYRSAVIMNESFFKLNTRLVDNLISEIHGSMRSAEHAALRMMNDTYRDVIAKAAIYQANGVMTEAQAVDMATKDFLNRGLNCIEYSDGRRVNIADYTQMAVRTAQQRAYMMGAGDFRKSIGRTLIHITKHSTSCPLCKPFESKVLIDDVYSGGKQSDGDYMLLSRAMQLGLFHPRCRHGSGTYYPELEGINQYETEDNRLNDYGQHNEAHIDNMIQRYKRLTLGSFDPDNVKRYRERLEYWQNRKSELAKNESDKIYYIGKINKKIYSCVTDDIITDEVIITGERIEHIREHHPNDFEKFCSSLSEAIKNPDYILASDMPNTAFVLKQVDIDNKNLQIILRLTTSADNPNYKNSIITALGISKKKWNKYLRNKKILYKSE